MSGNGSLEDRIEQLEASLRRLEDVVSRVAQRLDTLPPRRTERAAPADRPRLGNRLDAPKSDTASAARPRPKALRSASSTPKASAGPGRDSQWWLSRIGIGLLLVGVVYLFRYAVDQGWLSPLLRVLMGLALAVGLIVLGIRLHPTRGWYARALLVGGIVTHFITAYAAFHWYDLVPQIGAIGFLAFVSLVSLGLAFRLNDVSVAITGAIGALLNPIILFQDPGSIPVLMSYHTGTLAVLAGVFLVKGWRSLLWTSFYLGWAILFMTAVATGAADRMWTQIGIAAALVAFWLVPVFRERLIMLDPKKWPRPPWPGSGTEHPHHDRHSHVLSVLTPLIALGATAGLWDLTRQEAGWLAVAGAGVALVMTAIVHRWRAGDRLAFSQSVTVVTLLTLALSLLLDGSALLVALTVEGAALHIIGIRTADEIPLRAGQAMLMAVSVWVGWRLVTLDASTPPAINANALVDALVIVVGVWLASRLTDSDEASGYRLAAHIFLLAWLARELSALPNGSAIVTLSWGVYGIGLFVYALVKNKGATQRVAMATLLLVVAKLFLVDLAQLAPVWRIILFMGFGGVFLVLSYYFHDLWIADRASAEEPPATPQPSEPSS